MANLSSIGAVMFLGGCGTQDTSGRHSALPQTLTLLCYSAHKFLCLVSLVCYLELLPGLSVVPELDIGTGRMSSSWDS